MDSKRYKEYVLNVIPCILKKTKVNVSFTESVKDKYIRIHHSKLPNEVKGIYNKTEKNYVYWTDKVSNETKSVDLENEENYRFKRDYLKKILSDYLTNKFTSSYNYIHNVTIYKLIDEKKSYSIYERYTIKLVDNYLIQNFGILLSYDGISKISKFNIYDLLIQYPDILQYINRVLTSENQIIKLTIKEKNNLSKKNQKSYYPLLSIKLMNALKIPIYPKRTKNKYLEYKTKITKFYEKQLSGITIDDTLEITKTGLLHINSNLVKFTSKECNLLVFNNGKTHFNAYHGLMNNGPLGLPSNMNIKFLFIFHNDDKDFANNFYSYMKKGIKNYPGLEQFVSIPFDVDIPNTITFKNDNPISEITSSLDKIELDYNTQYLAFYISRIDKDDDDEEQRNVYYKLKKILLEHNISSQVISKRKLADPNYNYYLPNISIAVLSKLGGIPWRLSRPIKNDLVVGIGAYKHQTVNKYIGNTLCFRNDGTFNKFDAFYCDGIIKLSDTIYKSISSYIQREKNIKRLIIHYYKEMNYKEEKEIISTLEKLNTDIPYIILNINDTESRDFVFFETSYNGVMPISGSF
jgi:hypothetical protein